MVNEEPGEKTASSVRPRATSDVVEVRRQSQRPGFFTLAFRTVLIVAVNMLALSIVAHLSDNFSIDGRGSLVLAGIVIGLLNGVVWPALSALITPLSVLTLGIGALVMNAALTFIALRWLPGVHVNDVWTGLEIAIGITLTSALVASITAVNDDAWVDEGMIRRVSRSRKHAIQTDTPGVVFVQIDGLSRPVLENALAAGTVPTLYKWLDRGSHNLYGWQTEWSSQTGVSQCGILHGSVEDMPAFRWYEKENHRLMVSNHPDSAAEIEKRHSDGNGLLAHNGSSYGNLFSGDAERAVMTMSNGGQVREGKIGSGYVGYFAHPSNALRTAIASVGDMVNEWLAATRQIRRGVRPRVHRGFIYAFLRTFTTTISRDVCVSGILRDMAEGRAAIYVDLLGYDEVAHHSGPSRSDAMRVLRNIDAQIERIDRATQWCPRPYRLVVLSDHGQTQGPCFSDQYGETIMKVIGGLINEQTATDPASEEGKTESSAWFRPQKQKGAPHLSGKPTVLGSGNLALVYLPGPERRLTRSEIDEQHPNLIKGLVEHAGIGFVLVAVDEDTSVAIGANGEHWFPSGKVVGDDPLAPFGEYAEEKVAKANGYPHIGDLMINSAYDPIRDEVTAFELQVGSHGGLGGNQMYPFLLAPSDMKVSEPLVGPTSIYTTLKSFLADLGQPVTVRDVIVDASPRERTAT